METCSYGIYHSAAVLLFAVRVAFRHLFPYLFLTEVVCIRETSSTDVSLLVWAIFDLERYVIIP